MPMFQMGVLGNQLCAIVMLGKKASLGSTIGVSFGTSERLRLAKEPKCCGRI